MFHIARLERRRDGHLESWLEMGLTFSTKEGEKVAEVAALADCIRDTNKSKSGSLSIVLLLNGNVLKRADNIADSEFNNQRNKVVRQVMKWQK